MTKSSDQGPDAERAKRDDLLARIEKAEKGGRVRQEVGSFLGDTSQAVSATRIGADFVASVLMGGALGWAADQVLGSKPWGLLVCLLIGFGLGFWNIVRTLSRPEAKPEQNKKDVPHGDGLTD